MNNARIPFLLIYIAFAGCAPPCDQGNCTNNTPDAGLVMMNNTPTPTMDCTPIPRPTDKSGTGHLGGDAFHNQCADGFPPNDFWDYPREMAGQGHDAIVRGPD